MRVIINGDDFGYTLANTYGIIEAYKNGLLRSTTALVNSSYIAEAAELSKKYEGLGVGLHLTLTLGKSLTETKTLTDENGYFFPGPNQIWRNNPDDDEIYNEWKAQIEKFIEVFGKKPTHLDSHHSVHCRTEHAIQISQKLAAEYDLPMRNFSSFTFVRDFSGKNISVESLKKIFIDHEHEDIEIMCHPGFCDLELYRMSSYSLQRVVELDVLCSSEMKQFVEEHHIELTHY